jgi:hypothetical protein
MPQNRKLAVRAARVKWPKGFRFSTPAAHMAAVKKVCSWLTTAINSKTADVGTTMAHGARGPREVCVYVVADI